MSCKDDFACCGSPTSTGRKCNFLFPDKSMQGHILKGFRLNRKLALVCFLANVVGPVSGTVIMASVISTGKLKAGDESCCSIGHRWSLFFGILLLALAQYLTLPCLLLGYFSSMYISACFIEDFNVKMDKCPCCSLNWRPQTRNLPNDYKISLFYNVQPIRRPMAILCFILNIILPGFGTLMVGFFSLCGDRENVTFSCCKRYWNYFWYCFFVFFQQFLMGPTYLAAMFALSILFQGSPAHGLPIFIGVTQLPTFAFAYIWGVLWTWKVVKLSNDPLVSDVEPISRPAAIICLLVNILLPGIGTIMSGMMPHTVQVNAGRTSRTRGRYFLFCLWNGLSQIMTIPLFLFGYYWAIMWSVELVKLALNKVSDGDEHAEEIRLDGYLGKKLGVTATRRNVTALVLDSWRGDLALYGRDANGIKHKRIRIKDVQPVHNTEVLQRYENKKREFQARLRHRNDNSQFHAFQTFEQVSQRPALRENKHMGHIFTCVESNELYARLDTSINEVYLCHGTNAAEAIAATGFDMEYAHPGLYGRGMYFTDSSTKSNQYADKPRERRADDLQMFLCRVLLGSMKMSLKPDGRLLAGPCLKCGNAEKHVQMCDLHADPNDFADCVVHISDRQNFKEFIVYDVDQIYPEYLITYNRYDDQL